MKHDFIDRYSDLDSPIARRDPRAKLVAVLGAILIIATEPRGELLAFAWYAPLVLMGVLVSRLPLTLYAARLAIAAPFVLGAAALLPLSSWLAGGLAPAGNIEHAMLIGSSLVARASCAVLLLSLLASSTRFSDLLWGLRRLGMPPLVGTVSALMYRYAFILQDEVLRTNMARAEPHARPASPRAPSPSSGAQAATVFLRGWERAHRVHGAMLARGFNGEYPG
ncbi:MAG: hypothetical protein HC882_03860, partial [Acidobacteria bacterium]|nr:hypothetical protein [Acidobacteriota bacterium]